MHPGSHDLDPQSALGPDARRTHSPGGAECFPPVSCPRQLLPWGRGLTCTLQTRPRWLSDLSLNNSVGSMEIKQEIFLLKDNTL